MSVATVYGRALFELACEEGKDRQVLSQLQVLDEAFREEPDFIRLLCSANVPKAERCQILDSFRGKTEQCLLNFMKLLTEKGYMRHFSDCCKEYRSLYNEANGILEVRAVSAVPLTTEQEDRLRGKLARITGKDICLLCTTDETVRGGMRLDYDGKRLDDTLQHRLQSIRQLLANTVL